MKFSKRLFGKTPRMSGRGHFDTAGFEVPGKSKACALQMGVLRKNLKPQPRSGLLDALCGGFRESEQLTNLGSMASCGTAGKIVTMPEARRFPDLLGDILNCRGWYLLLAFGKAILDVKELQQHGKAELGHIGPSGEKPQLLEEKRPVVRKIFGTPFAFHTSSKLGEKNLA